MNDLSRCIRENQQFTDEELSVFSHALLKNIRYLKAQKAIEWEIEFPEMVSYEIIDHLKAYLNEEFTAQPLLKLSYKNKSIDLDKLQEYLSMAAEKLHSEELSYAICKTEGTKDILLQFANQENLDAAESIKDAITACFEEYGLNYDFRFELKQRRKPKKVISEDDMYHLFPLSEIKEPRNNVKTEGFIYRIEDSKSLRNGGRNFNDNETITYYIRLENNYLLCNRYVSKDSFEDVIAEFKKEDYVCVKGNIVLNRNNSDLEMLVQSMYKADRPEQRKDKAKRKRVELHAHTKMSEMDGISSATELINQAAAWGHKAIAITDHYVVQAFPEAQIAMRAINKKNPDSFKVIYGCEMNMVDPILHIVTNPNGKPLSTTYVVFDLETTGLSNRYDHIIEFGGVKVSGGAVIDRLQLFVKPPVKLAEFTKHLTNIRDEDVENADPIEVAIDQILNFFGDSVLVAHNAEFDIGFINANLKKLGRSELSNAYIDTLDLSRALLKERKSYRLGRVCGYYKIDYDEDVAHRADYDAEVTSQVFIKMISSLQRGNVMFESEEEEKFQTVDDLQKLSDQDSFKKVNKKHVNILAKNQQGIKDLFKLVSLSHTDYLVFGGKVTTKSDEFMAEPRIPREEIRKIRENLIIGSACCNGEIFDIASTESKEHLKNAMKFYDFIEVQPPENYRFLIENHSIATMERLQEILRDIIDCARELQIPVCATGDVHYTNPDQKVLRDVYIQAQGIGGVVHPLYIYNAEARKKSIAPDQHFRTTDEMLEAFSFLNDTELAEEIVIDNTNYIADMVEVAYPCKDKLYPPAIDGADENLKNLCYKNAHKLYGENLPELVSSRLEKELNSIIGNGYGVIYYTAHLMVKDSNDHGYMVGSRGSVGSSFVATMSEITEVNPLPPHYICPHCHHFELAEDAESGFDLPPKKCPDCGQEMIADGQDIPFETFLGFYGDKVPDIDLNFSSEYQGEAMLYTKNVFGEDNVYRAGTISGVQEKTAFGYIRGYMEKMGIERMSQAERLYLAQGCTDVKRTTGQHPGGIIVIPRDMDVLDFTPVQYPANNPESEWKTTHFDFHAIHDNVLKLDNLGHVDPTCMKLLEKISGIDVRTINMNDAKVISIFNSTNALGIKDKSAYGERTGAMGLPEFGTRFVRGILSDTKPTKFSQLVRISGLSHGTDVWSNNAKDLVARGFTLNDVIGCRDDIMLHLIKEGLPPKDSFDIMESVRKGKGLKDNWIELMRANDVPEWYIDSCLKIKYMFPKAHAVAYVMMAVRVAWFKVYYPLYYYISFFTLRCDYFEIDTMIQGQSAIRDRLKDINERMNSKDREIRRGVTNKEEGLITTLEVANELYCRGFKISNISLDYSLATEWRIDPNAPDSLIPAFVTLDGLGENVAQSIVQAREEREFLSKEDLLMRTQLSQTLLDKLDAMGVLSHLQNENQMSLF